MKNMFRVYEIIKTGKGEDVVTRMFTDNYKEARNYYFYAKTFDRDMRMVCEGAVEE